MDDLEANLKVLATVLGFAGYTSVKCLNDSRQALSSFTEFGPDLVVLDYHMPHLDGLGVMDQLAGVTPQDDYLPILMLTGDATPRAKEEALSRGAHDFLTKPLNSTEVQLRVRNLLQTRSLHQQLKARNASLEDSNRKLKEAQALLIQSEKMASLGQLVAGIAHEINNPLAFVSNNIFVVREALDRLAAEVPPEALPRLDKTRTRIREMAQGADRVRDLVSKLRTFSRLDEGKFKTVDIHESIESVLLFLRHKTEGRIEVERNYCAAGDLSCFAGELNQVLMNVIANAIDSIEGPGKITVATKRQNGQFVILVRDTGKGIPEEIRSRVFDPFFTTKPVGYGTGLGLAISYGIIKAHNGSIEFSSEDGKGTEFTLRIPASLETGVNVPSTLAS